MTTFYGCNGSYKHVNFLSPPYQVQKSSKSTIQYLAFEFSKSTIQYLAFEFSKSTIQYLAFQFSKSTILSTKVFQVYQTKNKRIQVHPTNHVSLKSKHVSGNLLQVSEHLCVPLSSVLKLVSALMDTLVLPDVSRKVSAPLIPKCGHFCAFMFALCA